MLQETANGEAAPAAAAGQDARVLAGRYALALGGLLLLLLAAVEGAHWQGLSWRAASEQVVQQPAPITSPASHPDVSAPDPGDNP